MTHRFVRLAALVFCGLMMWAARAEAVRIAVLADTQGFSASDVPYNDRLLPLQIEAILKARPTVDAVLVCGDLIHGQTTADAVIADLLAWRAAIRPLVDAGIAVYVVPGNHDLMALDGADAAWQAVFSDLPANGPADELYMTYSFDLGAAHIAAVCNESPKHRHRVNTDWLAADLADSDAKVKIVFGHDPAFPDARHIGASLDAYPNERDIFWQTLIDHGVTLYLCGHAHTYDHWINTGVHQIICDGSDKFGFSYRYLLLDIDDAGNTHVTVKRLNGIVYDEFDLSDLNSGDTDDRGANATPAPTPAVRVAVLADTQKVGEGTMPYNERLLPLQLQAILAADPPVHAVIVCGDLVEGQTDIATELQHWRQAMQPIADAGIALYVVPGNHDLPYLFSSVAAWQSTFYDMPSNGPADELYMTYSFDLGAAHFVAICNESPTNRHGINHEWLENDLAKSTAKVKIVFGHDPAFPANHHIGFCMDYHPLLRDRFWQTLADNGVTLYLSGHEHTYDHWAKDGIHQIVCDGGNKPGLTYRLPIIDISADGDAVVTVTQLNSTVIETFNLNDTTGVPNEARRDNVTLLYDVVTACPIAAMLAMAGCVAASLSLGQRQRTPRRSPHA
jgi:predicted MPP superfamily phosphohydrolase